MFSPDNFFWLCLFPTLLHLFSTQMAGLVDLQKCELGVCSNCFSTKATCHTRNKSEVVPQYLNKSLLFLKLTFRSPDAHPVELLRLDMKRYSRLQRLNISGDFCSIEAGAMDVLPDLSTLHIWRTSIQHLPDYLLASNDKLKEIILAGNLFTEIPFNMFNSSRKIPLTSYTFSNHDNVVLSCINGTMHLPSAFANIKHFNKVDLSYNSFYNSNCFKVNDDFFKPISTTRHLCIGGTNFIHNNEFALKDLVGFAPLTSAL